MFQSVLDNNKTTPTMSQTSNSNEDVDISSFLYFELADHFKVKCEPYEDFAEEQVKCVLRMEDIHENETYIANNISAMGLGKTYTAIMLAQRRGNHIVVVCPANMVTVWEDILGIYCGKRHQGGVISYERLSFSSNKQVDSNNKYLCRKKGVYSVSKKFRKVGEAEGWMVVVDEFHRIKNDITFTEAVQTLTSEIFCNYVGDDEEKAKSRVLFTSASPFDKIEQLITYLKIANMCEGNSTFKGNEKKFLSEIRGLINLANFYEEEATQKILRNLLIRDLKENGEKANKLIKYVISGKEIKEKKVFVTINYEKRLNLIDKFMLLCWPYISVAMNGDDKMMKCMYYDLFYEIENKKDVEKLAKLLYDLELCSRRKGKVVTGKKVKAKEGESVAGKITTILKNIEIIFSKYVAKYAVENFLKKGKKVMIGTNYNAENSVIMNTMKDIIESEGYTMNYIIGSTNSKKRAHLAKEFREGKLNVLGVNAAAACTGISCDCIYIDGEPVALLYIPDFGWHKGLQISGRVTRITSQQESEVYCMFPYLPEYQVSTMNCIVAARKSKGEFAIKYMSPYMGSLKIPGQYKAIDKKGKKFNIEEILNIN